MEARAYQCELNVTRISSESSLHLHCERKRKNSGKFCDVRGANNNKLVAYFNPTYTRTGWIGQPPVLDRHEVVTVDGDVVTLRQATP